MSTNVRDTRAQRRQDVFDRVTSDILELSQEVIDGIVDVGITCLADILSLDGNSILTLSISDTNGNLQLLPLFIISKIRILQAWNLYIINIHNIKCVDCMDQSIISIDEFDTFRVSVYDPNLPVRDTSILTDSNASINSTTTNNSNESSRQVRDFRKKC